MTKPQNAANLTGADRLLNSVPEVAFYLNVCTRTAYNLIKTGKLPSKRIGSRVFVPREALEKFVKK